jgi:hypothetical protein
MSIQTLTEKHHFRPIGAYFLRADGTVGRRKTVRVTQRLPLVYALGVGDECRYIGKSVQGYGRPLNYHKNEVMTDVRDGIREELQAGHEVTVYARTEHLRLNHGGLALNLMVAIEEALIRLLLPRWNNQVHEE